ncbi:MULTISPECIES: hypothetical protein [unclassified Pseudoalteromonas]|uniref:hypothetical protein n=1 Tax=unclassified Pseudoalteromonas TaxID=194690 RepID=UPI0006D65529|nr:MULTISPECIES: hypothetical protein [unclassified Pseudoalteromonas]KPZ54307.1 hypothetical protein AN393_02400 [Pseudoalteromonas sp. P1-25]KPZ57248.1 hypothetical protein AN389_03163 [Pseudoalteromonas sp. P1-7a]
MEKLAYLIIGAAVAVIVMTLFPLAQDTNGASDTAKAPMQMTMSGMVGHSHPPREVSAELPAPTVTHLVFPDAMDGYNVQILTENFTFTPSRINRKSVFNEGHAHIYLNGAKIARAYSMWFHLPGSLMQPGENTVTVTLNANDHGEWSRDGEPISSTVIVHGPVTRGGQVTR